MADVEPTAAAIGVLLLAAGSGTRFMGPEHKLLTIVEGKPIIEWALEHALDAHIGTVAVVYGAIEIPRPPSARTVDFIRNPEWQLGMASSVQCGLQWATDRGLQSVVIGLGDQPCIPPSAWIAVAQTRSPLAVATYQGIRANPVKIDAEFFSHIPTTGDVGARLLLQSHPELVTEVPCSGSGIDVDRVEDIDRIATCIHES